MTITLIVLNKQWHISMVSSQMIAAVRVQAEKIIIHWHLNSADCCLIGIILGVTRKNIPQ